MATQLKLLQPAHPPRPAPAPGSLSVLELCAGAGGQALGFEQAGFEHAALVELNRHACATLGLNRPDWTVFEEDIEQFDGTRYRGVDVLAAGLPCPPFSVAGKQLGKHDDRNLFPAALRLTGEMEPRAVMIENVRGILDPVFEEYRGAVAAEFAKLGYVSEWRLMNASDFGVPQLRPRAICIALRSRSMEDFNWPAPVETSASTVGEVLSDLMASRGWAGAAAWSAAADMIAPTIVGGSHKHGGPDLGPTRARKAWARLGVDGLGIANDAPSGDFIGMPRLTVSMVARLQGFPDSWRFSGGKTQSYRQVGNAFPPPFAHAVASCLRACLVQSASVRKVG
ncbi:MAG: DNA (cytosine-5-)-methyltransferase [Bryobacterales bacterium]|nr:DNA (cytosine-5-)-methyltransferase [Bryobacterales bacterium]